MTTRSVEEILRVYTSRLMAISGVVGTAEGARDDGTPCILVAVDAPPAEMAALLPESLGGYPVEVRDVGEIKARRDA